LKRTLTAIAVALAAVAALAVPGLATARDHNRDRIPDKWEKHFHLSLKVDQANRDQDNDGVDNMCEFKSGDNPRDADSNNDGAEDQNDADAMECEADEQENENEAEDQDGDHHGSPTGTEDNSGPGSSNDG